MAVTNANCTIPGRQARRSRVALLGAATAAIGLWALFSGISVAEESSFSVRSIDEVADGAMPQVTDVSATEAVLVFRSKTNLACSVVFGETLEFGSVAVDADMDGGAHSDHHPALTGLKPATKYFFRVQGVAADGTLYVGEVQSFRTANESTDGPVDLAALAAGARVAAVSSNYGGAKNDERWGADNAFDGSRSTAWSSSGDGNDAFIEIELAQPTHVGEISVWTRSMSDGTAQILHFTVTTDQGTVHGPFEL
ncbi:MAG: hypothetical protein GY798_10450, partial [Hyphomicrobiales bacterium]|nr:hypothetical protein [Hyphomicrobiales bacterium]